jgi:hypothetical protein
MSSPLQIAVLVMLGAALWGLFYIINVLSRETERPRAERGSTRRTPSKGKNGPWTPRATFRFREAGYNVGVGTTPSSRR